MAIPTGSSGEQRTYSASFGLHQEIDPKENSVVDQSHREIRDITTATGQSKIDQRTIYNFTGDNNRIQPQSSPEQSSTKKRTFTRYEKAFGIGLVVAAGIFFTQPSGYKFSI